MITDLRDNRLDPCKGDVSPLTNLIQSPGERLKDCIPGSVHQRAPPDW